MHKEHYLSALEKIRTDEAFKNELEERLKGEPLKRIYTGRALLKPSWISVAAACVLTLGLALGGAAYLNGWSMGSPNLISDKGSLLGASQDGTSDFEITGKMGSNVDACYMSVVFIDGYTYTYNSWLSYERLSISNLEALTGEQLGEVTLDLKDILYTGTPPDFSSTLSKGTPVFAVKGMKTERAVIVGTGEYASLYYRTAKVNLEKEALTVSRIMTMLSENPTIKAVELRSEEDASWLGTWGDKALLELLEKELPGLQVVDLAATGKESPTEGPRVPVNLVMEDGAILHMQVYPDSNYVSIFGGYMKISSELSQAFAKLNGQKPQVPTLEEVAGVEEGSVNYMKLYNPDSSVSILCSEPQWSREPFFDMMSYYRMEKTDVGADSSSLYLTVELGQSAEDSKALRFYDIGDGKLAVEVEGVLYTPARGYLPQEELDNFISSYTN